MGSTDSQGAVPLETLRGPEISNIKGSPAGAGILAGYMDGPAMPAVPLRMAQRNRPSLSTLGE